MTYVITQNCCKDASCVPVCPVDCIRPVGEAGTQSLYIDPETCIDCGACLEECPVDAIHYEDDLPPELERFKDLNAAYFERHPLADDEAPARKPHDRVDSLRVAVVGTGPAGCYAAKELAGVDGVEVDLFERLNTPFGLIRAGVAPDHQHTKAIAGVFDSVFHNRHVHCHFGVDIGKHFSHEDLLAHHHAVIYAVGAHRGRDLGIAGEDVAGAHTAAEFVNWYNGHPEHADSEFDLSGERAVIIGNGNVALDMARMLLLGRDALAVTDIADYALNSLARSTIREVVILGRRGARAAAFSAGELMALGHLPDIDIAIEGDDLDPHPDDGVEMAFAMDLLREYHQRPSSPNNGRILFRFNTTPVEYVGDGRVTGVRVQPSGEPQSETDIIDAGLVLRSIGHLGEAIGDLPFDSAQGIIPNTDGRVVDRNGDPLTGVYVTGWIKRGPNGVIGTNRRCAEQTVDRLWEDYDSGLLNRQVSDRDALRSSLVARDLAVGDWTDWHRIDAAERQRGTELSRPRVKFIAIADMLAAARQR